MDEHGAREPGAPTRDEVWHAAVSTERQHSRPAPRSTVTSCVGASGRVRSSQERESHGGLRRTSRPLAPRSSVGGPLSSIGATARCASSNIAELVFSPHATRRSRRRNEVPIGGDRCWIPTPPSGLLKSAVPSCCATPKRGASLTPSNSRQRSAADGGTCFFLGAERPSGRRARLYPWTGPGVSPRVRPTLHNRIPLGAP